MSRIHDTVLFLFADNDGVHFFFFLLLLLLLLLKVLFSYEEAIGYCLGDVVKDKDGVAAAAVFAEMANYIRVEKNMTVAAHLESLYQSVGYFERLNHYIIIHDKGRGRID